ncbi:thioredoxin [Actinoplanes cyaneus]|uniref:Thioredoxin n=1 Tax=Actinoplanes cyaneus TaxID=52696 RepID=A0A919IPU4_9ACTN|nr:thioredoxin family protein [Actinoplanes cyaneus]MCW2139084.1 thioredoxin 1 [Actinoplanes cyaneus]GID68986.1 thioredoxin [Actinoplanes cyaneus]
MTLLAYFSAPWCAPCRKFGPLLTAEAQARGLSVQRFDVDRDARTSAQNGITSVPTVLVWRDGQVVDRFGQLPPAALRERLEAACGR